jgi:hypothetical protein
MIPGLTNMLSAPSKSRWALYVAFIVPLSKCHGAESFPVGVTGDGSKAVPQASASVSVPADAPSWPEIGDPKAEKVRLNSLAKCFRTFVSRSRTATVELLVSTD